MSSDLNETAVESIIETAIASAEPNLLDEVDGLYAVALPGQDRVEIIDTRTYRKPERPDRKTGHTSHVTSASLIQYVKAHKDAGTDLFANPTSLTVVAVLNDHGTDPAWGDHRAALTFQRTPAWKRWTDKDRKMLPQSAFAEHVEENITEIVNPSGADLLELAQSFRASKSGEFESDERLANGEVKLLYKETIAARAGRAGELVIPDTFDLSVSPFDGADAAPITARLRYRIDGGQLFLGYYLNQPEEFERLAFEAELNTINEGTGLVAYVGTPRS